MVLPTAKGRIAGTKILRAFLGALMEKIFTINGSNIFL